MTKMSQKIFFFLILIASFSPLFALEKVSLQLKWHHQFQFAGYYAALEKGFYAEEGLDVTLKNRDTAKNNIEQVLNGDSEYGIADSVLLLYQAHQKPIVIIAPIFQHSPNVLITLKNSGIDSPYKLIGKKVAFYTNDADGLPILAMMHETGILKKGFNRVNTNFDINALTSKKVDAHHGYITNEPFAMLQKGIETNIINPQHFGVDLYGDMLFTTLDELKNHPKRVAAMKRATLRGWQYALSHREEIIQLIRSQYAPQKTLEQLRYEAEGISSVIDSATIPLGTLDYGRLEYIQNLLSRHGLISSRVPIDEYIYREAHSGSVDLTEEEREWLRNHPVIRTAIDTGWAPFEYLDEEGNYKGLAADYLALISQKLGIRFEPHTDGIWKDAVKLMSAHRLDMYPCAVKTPEREVYALFTSPYLNFRMVILTDENVGYIDSVSALKNHTVAVARGYLPLETLKRYYPHIKRLEVNTIAEGLEAVASGKAYAFVDNTAAITHALKTQGYSNLKISGELPHRFELSMGVRNDWPIFAGILEKTLASMTTEERDAIYARHIKVEYSQQISWERLFQISIPLAILIGILLYYTRKLRQINKVYKMTMDSLSLTQKELEGANARLQTLSTTDTLTELANRYRLDEAMKQTLSSAKRYSRALSIIMIDLDYFKSVNDSYGHHAGDSVLKSTAALLMENCRQSDIIGRWGGEEFLIICPETNLQEAVLLAEKLRGLFPSVAMVYTHTQTASFGVCAYEPNDTPETLIIRADEALYQAKHDGRNCVRIS